ncbi:glycosyltransferase family 2 protein [Aromatoleum anaerobium]|uniref:Glycosyltransferase n=1 Tax=Aromatoleum anaerobium TaxID=182180 RepID=A0ABX1PFJ3_9RHOO|nr:glycosyltransferase family 2 protein [Aromatoleum anaerobium]MCK0509209.1 glycosyltransferase family 2 protein [Aromatoleum anaerobium]
MTDTPRVSVVIPAYNAAWCLTRAIGSVLTQSFRDFELIVVDDGSTDETAEMLSRYGDVLRIVSKENGGMGSARNAGIRTARGRYVAFLDADDCWLPEKLARQVALLEAHPDLAFCAVVATLEDPAGLKIGEWRGHSGSCAGISEVFANHAAVAGGASAVVAHRQLVVELGGFDETLAGAEDTDLWIRLAGRGDFACIDEPLVVVLRRPGSASRSLDAMRRGALEMTRKNRNLLPPGKRHAFWRKTYAGLLCDYAKWAYREGRHGAAMKDLLTALCMSPFGRGRLALGLMAAVLRGQRV